MEATTAAVSPAQFRILELIKRRGEATVDELSGGLGVSPSAVRQQLGALRSAGLVTSRQERGLTGRPADHYRTTDLTESMFATSTDRASIELLRHVEMADPVLLAEAFDRRRREKAEVIRPALAGKSLGEKVEYLAGLLDAEGFLTDTEGSRSTIYHLNLHNCPMWDLARHFAHACSSELEFLRDLLPEASVERPAHKAAGAHSCVYVITG